MPVSNLDGVIRLQRFFLTILGPFRTVPTLLPSSNPYSIREPHFKTSECRMNLTFIGLYIHRLLPTICDVSQFIYFCTTLYMFQTVFRPSSEAQNCTYSVRYLSDQYCYLLLAARLAAGSSIGLTNTWRCMCSFELLMMDEKQSETCRASYRNK